MANRIKKKTPPPPNPDQLKPEKEEQVSVKEVVKDERTQKIAGAISLLLAIFLFIALICPFNDSTKPDPDCFRMARE